MSPETGVFPQPARFTRVTARRLAHHPEDGFVSWLHSLRFLHECNPSYGVLTLSPVGLSPTEHASFSLDALWSKFLCGTAVIVEQAAEPVGTADCSLRNGDTRSKNREEQEIILALVVSLLVIMLQILGHDTP